MIGHAKTFFLSILDAKGPCGTRPSELIVDRGALDTSGVCVDDRQYYLVSALDAAKKCRLLGDIGGVCIPSQNCQVSMSLMLVLGVSARKILSLGKHPSQKSQSMANSIHAAL
jgi:hypothetical protein